MRSKCGLRAAAAEATERRSEVTLQGRVLEYRRIALEPDDARGAGAVTHRLRALQNVDPVECRILAEARGELGGIDLQHVPD